MYRGIGNGKGGGMVTTRWLTRKRYQFMGPTYGTYLWYLP